EKTYSEQVKQLEIDVSKNPSVGTQTSLAQAYADMAGATIAASGSLDLESRQRANSLYSKAAAVYSQLNYKEKYADRLIRRATLLTDGRTIAGLETAIKLYDEARTALPSVMRGDVVVTSADGNAALVGPSYSGLVMKPLFSTGPDVDLSLPDRDI